ncbi:MAG: TIGR03905 family TSCPD domain-containing protein [Bacteroidales bacterium]|nr:TIGR03905 family TSCPD domain-containing protein [Bacteroidales bacterium]
MKNITYRTMGTCSSFIDIELDGDIINEVTFIGGCAGNTQGVAKLLKGMKVEDAIQRLKGIDCGGKGTSCPDQLAQALIQAKERGEC